MVARRKNTNAASRSRLPPATTPEARENQLIAAAYDLAEQRLLDGTASAQETTFFLKMGSTREKLEQERLAIENDLSNQKIELMKSQQRQEELIADALNAMRGYQGIPNLEDDYDDDY